MRRTITRSQLKGIIREAIIESGKHIRKLNEGTNDTALADAWEECVWFMGAEKMLDEIFHMLSEDEIREALEQLNRLYNLELSYFED